MCLIKEIMCSVGVASLLGTTDLLLPVRFRSVYPMERGCPQVAKWDYRGGQGH